MSGLTCLWNIYCLSVCIAPDVLWPRADLDNWWNACEQELRKRHPELCEAKCDSPAKS